MNTTLTKTMKTVFAIAAIFSLTLFATPDHAMGQIMKVAPDKICLNGQGNTESIQAIVPTTLESGYLFSGCTATLSVGGIVIAEAYDAKYCYVDNNLLIYFDRVTILSNADMAAMAGTFQTAMVEGELVMEDADGNSLTRSFTAYDEVEIIDPDQRGSH